MEEKEIQKIIAFKTVKFAIIMSTIIVPAFLVVESAKNWGLTRQQKIFFYGFFTVFFGTLFCYTIYYLIRLGISGKKLKENK